MRTKNVNKIFLVIIACIVAYIFLLIIFMFANKYIVRGFTQSGIK